MDRYEIEKAIASFYKMHPPSGNASVITVINPEELGDTSAAIYQALWNLNSVGFYVVVPNQTNPVA